MQIAFIEGVDEFEADEILHIAVPALCATGHITPEQRDRTIGADPGEARSMKVMKATDTPGMPAGSAARQGVLTKAAWKQFVVALIIWLRVVDQGLAELVVAISEGWGSTDPGWYKQAGAGAA